MQADHRRKRRLGDVLLQWGSIRPADLERAVLLQRSATIHERLGTVLMRERLIDERTLTAALAELHGLHVVDLDVIDIDPTVARSLERSVAERYLVIPIATSGEATAVAVADPFDVIVGDDLRTRLPGQVNLVVAAPSQIRRELALAWEGAVNESVIEDFVGSLAVSGHDVVVRDVTLDGAMGVVDHIVSAAAERRASDIHIEPGAHFVKVRVRVDGMMQDMLRLPSASLAPIVSRVKVLSGLDVFNRRGPQDGRAHIRTSTRDLELRVSTMPSMHGENVVMRILPNHQSLPKLAEMGLTWNQIDLIAGHLSRPQGSVIVTGPTGSGKTTTIYSILKEFITSERNTITVEDPVEMEMVGLTQVQIDEVAGITFPSALRAALRQDPDVVVVGEVRDHETAQMAVSAALTGHLVLSTLHTQDAPSAVTRMSHMGVPGYLVAEALGLVIGQRLLRRPCPFCSVPTTPDVTVQTALRLTPEQNANLLHGEGCSMCGRTGYLGRVGVFELLQMTPEVREIVLADGSADAIATAGRKSGYQPMRETAPMLAVQGLTTAEEILRTIDLSN